MKKASPLADLFMPWAGLAVGVVAAGFVHQFGSEGVFNDCRAISPIPILLVALIGIVVTVVAGFASWGIIRDGAETQARKVVAIVSVGSAALFVLAMILPMIASLVLPPCFQ